MNRPVESIERLKKMMADVSRVDFILGTDINEILVYADSLEREICSHEIITKLGDAFVCDQCSRRWDDDADTFTDSETVIKRLERAEAAIEKAMGQGTWDDAFNVLAEYQEAKDAN